MRVLMINTVCGIGSTGRICTDLADDYSRNEHEVKIAYGRGIVPEKYKKYSVCIGSKFSVVKNALSCRAFDNDGLQAKMATKSFLKWADEFNPDVLWLHNLHGYYINVELLFQWIKSRQNMQVKWTLHDCWAFTGHCSHFTMANCKQWITQCSYCPQKRQYPASYFKDNCRKNFERKRQAFTGVKNMQLIAPSKWLASLVEISYLKDYPIEVINNKIDTKIFKPTPSDFRKKYGLLNKKVVLGVASTWNEHKGLQDFVKLADMLDDRFAIVLVGLSDKQIKQLGKKIVGIKKTNNSQELAEIYTAADVYVNSSREETFGMTTVEALSCGTDVIVYKDTACEEVIMNYGSKGIAVPANIEKVYDEIIRLTTDGKTK